VSTGLTLKAFVGVFVTCTLVPTLTVLLTGVELPYPLLAACEVELPYPLLAACEVELPYPLLAACVCAFEASGLVLPPPPQAATANELSATRMTQYATLDLILDICCSCHW
jgi:hypothetical protein